MSDQSNDRQRSDHSEGNSSQWRSANAGSRRQSREQGSNRRWERDDRRSQRSDRDDRGQRRWSRDDERGGPRRDDRRRGERQWDRNDRSPRRWERDDRRSQRSDRDDRGQRRWSRDDERGGPRRDDRRRGERQWDRDDRGRGGRRWDGEERSGRPYSRDDGSNRRWDRDERGERGSRDDRGQRRWSRDSDRDQYRRDDRRRGERRWDRDDRERRDGRWSDRHENRPSRGGYSSDSRGKERYERGEGRGRQSYDARDRYEDYRDLEIPESITANSLDAGARRRLMSLNKDNSERVARHLAYAGEMMDIDPQIAYQHAKAAYQRAARIDVVREALGLTAYATERYSEALRELRTYRRMSDDYSHVPIEADAERGLGRPEKALRFIEGIPLDRLSAEGKIELALVTSGARAETGDSAGGLAVLEKILVENLDPILAARVQLIKADRLEELGREEEATSLRVQWQPVFDSQGNYDMMVDLDDVLDDVVEDGDDVVEDGDDVVEESVEPSEDADIDSGEAFEEDLSPADQFLDETEETEFNEAFDELFEDTDDEGTVDTDEAL
ncbi:MAG: hypothetical protein WBH82_07160 [Arcanobacterium sp.]